MRIGQNSGYRQWLPLVARLWFRGWGVQSPIQFRSYAYDIIILYFNNLLRTSSRTATLGSAMLDKAYDPQANEDHIYKMWEDSGAFTADAKSKKEPFTISMPPPNATGNLHLGHAVMLALQ